MDVGLNGPVYRGLFYWKRIRAVKLEEATGLALRGTFIINPEGTLLNSEVNFYNMGRNVDEILRKVKANIYLAGHGEEGCPAQWKEEGDKTLTPTPDMVGKVYEALE